MKSRHLKGTSCGAIVSRVERKTTEVVSHPMTHLLKLYRHKVHTRTITSDNRREFSGHETITKQQEINTAMHRLHNCPRKDLDS